MSWTKVGAVLPAVLASCARMSVQAPDAGTGSLPIVTEVEPEPGVVPATASFVVHFSAPMDEGVLLASTGRSETVALAADADVDGAAAALEHTTLSTHERSLLIPAALDIAGDRRSVTLSPDRALVPGGYFLLVSPRLKDDAGRKIGGQTLRFPFAVEGNQPDPGAPRATLIAPAAGSEAPTNLAVVRASGPSGRVALLAPDGAILSAADAHGDVALPLLAPLTAGSRYMLALDGVAQEDQSFSAASCARVAPPSIESGTPQVSARDTTAEVRFQLDWPALVEVRIGKAMDGAPCTGECSIATQRVLCAPPACGPQVWACQGDVRIGGLLPGMNYVAQFVLQDDEGHAASSALQRFSTVAPLPRMLITEIKWSPTTGEYVELLNLGPGAADASRLALVGSDGEVRPLLGETPPLPVLLQPGARALAVGASFDASLYPSIPTGTPVLRAGTQRLLARGLTDRTPPPFRLVATGDLVVELADFPSDYMPVCALDGCLQRDETVPPEGDASWDCGRLGGTPGSPPF